MSRIESALRNLTDQVSGILEIWADDELIAAWREARASLTEG